jgi:hypothetical protein
MHDPFSTSQLHRLHDAAHRRAEALRRQARDDFWRGTDALIAGLATRAVRAADRLGHRLQRHGRRCPAA